MNSNPVRINTIADKGCRLNRIEANPGDPKDENWLQELLFRHPDLLPVDEFDEMFSPPIPIGREIPSGRGPIDDLYVSPNGGITIVETKLWKNPEKHRTVVAQIIDYAKELATWDYDDLAKAVLAASRNRNETDVSSLEEKVAASLKGNSIDLVEFQESVETNLREGNFLLLIVGDRISPNIALLTDAIHSAPGLGFQLGLVEMRLYPLVPGKDWPLIVVPDVVGRTVEKLRGVVRIRYTQEKQPEVVVDLEDESGGPSVPLDLDRFLSEIPKDLVSPYQEAIEKWREIGEVRFSAKTLYFRADVAGQPHKFVRSQTTRVWIEGRKRFASCCPDNPSLYDKFLDRLEKAPVVAEFARNDKEMITYDKLTADDVRVIVQASMSLVEDIQGMGPRREC
jgi:hypothetical protein